MLGWEQLQLIYEAAEDSVAAGRYTNAAKLLASLLVQDPEPDHARIAAVLDALIEMSPEPSALINRAAMLLDPEMGDPDPERRWRCFKMPPTRPKIPSTRNTR